MEELTKRLIAIPDSYDDFVAGIVSYAKRKQERLRKIIDFLDETPDALSSDVVEFVIMQPDFHEDGVRAKKEVKQDIQNI
ncbi:MAG: hypothetical protein IJA34_16900 [Lachnospiraceae bacterium]|nr:hypothetical protein [Lachnospiraceae bacterium]